MIWGENPLCLETPIYLQDGIEHKMFIDIAGSKVCSHFYFCHIAKLQPLHTSENPLPKGSLAERFSVVSVFVSSLLLNDYNLRSTYMKYIYMPLKNILHLPPPQPRLCVQTFKEPCKKDSAENPQVLFNTTCLEDPGPR